MSGKSTLLRAVGTNAVLAQAGPLLLQIADQKDIDAPTTTRGISKTYPEIAKWLTICAVWAMGFVWLAQIVVDQSDVV